MSISRITLPAAVAATVLWTAKAVAIALAGGNGKSPLEGPLFLLGLLAFVVATVCVGIGYAGRRGVAWKVLGVVVAIAVVTVVGGVLQAVFVHGTHPAWWRVELNLWAIMLVVLGAALHLRSLTSPRDEDPRDRTRRPRARAGAGPRA